MGGVVLEPRVTLCTVPVFHALGDVDDGAGGEGDGTLAPFLIPAATTDADENLVHTVVDMPVVAAAWLEGDVGDGQYGLLAFAEVSGLDGSQIAVVDEVLRIVHIGFALGESAAQGVALMVKPCTEFIYQFLRIAHIHRTAFEGCELRVNAFESAQSRYRYYLTVGRSLLVAGEDVAKEMRLQIVVILWTESVVERTA